MSLDILWEFGIVLSCLDLFSLLYKDWSIIIFMVIETITSGLVLILGLVLLWSLIWKGIALWKCGRNNQLGWFVVILIVNSLGILPIIYLAWFQKRVNGSGKKKRR